MQQVVIHPIRTVFERTSSILEMLLTQSSFQLVHSSTVWTPDIFLTDTGVWYFDDCFAETRKLLTSVTDMILAHNHAIENLSINLLVININKIHMCLARQSMFSNVYANYL